jgi:hypothetical protein
MRVDLQFRDAVLARFMKERLPISLMRRIGSQKQLLYDLAKTMPLTTQGQWIDRNIILADGRGYAVTFALGKVKKAGPEEEQIQELLILDIQESR